MASARQAFYVLNYFRSSMPIDICIESVSFSVTYLKDTLVDIVDGAELHEEVERQLGVVAEKRQTSGTPGAWICTSRSFASATASGKRARIAAREFSAGDGPSHGRRTCAFRYCPS